MRIVIIDDHPIVRGGLENTLSKEREFEIAGMASTCDEGVEMIEKEDPDIAIVDLRMPTKGGFDLISEIQEKNCETKLVVLTSYMLPENIEKAVKLKVDGYILKEALPEEVIKALKMVQSGRKYYDPEILQYIVNKEYDDRVDQLTEREKEIMGELAEGLNNKAIAKNLFISENTVKKHISNILDKLFLEDRTQAALYAFSKGFGNKNRDGNSEEEMFHTR